MLVFEFMKSLMLRKAQVTLISNFTAALRPAHLASVEAGDIDHPHYLAHQMIMGAGAAARLKWRPTAG